MQVARVLGLPGDGAKREDVTPFSDQTTLAARDRIGLAIGKLGAGPSQMVVRIGLELHATTMIIFCDTLSSELIMTRTHQKAKLNERLRASAFVLLSILILQARRMSAMPALLPQVTPISLTARTGLWPDHLSLLCSFRIAAIRPPPV